MNPLMTSLAGAAGGSLAGQMFDAPRRMLWQTLGLPDTGAELVQQQLGTSPDSPWTHALGMASEMALDPMTIAGLMSGSALAAVGRGGNPTEGLSTLTRAAEAASAKNVASGTGLLQEGFTRLGRAVTPADVEAAGARTGVYGFNPARTTGLEAASNVAPNLARPPVAGRGAIAQARQQLMGGNAAANDTLMGKALAAYGEPTAAGSPHVFQMPGMQLSPTNPLRQNPLAMMAPETALQQLRPMLAGMPQVMARRQRMGPLDYAALAGTGAGAIGGGVYSGYQGR